MSTKKVSELTETTTIGSSDLLLISSDNTGSYTSKKITWQNAINTEFAYAGIYVSDGSTGQNILTGTSYTKLTGFTTNGESYNCTADAANDKITITKAGKYWVSGSFSFSGSANVTFRICLFYDNTEISKIHLARKLGSGGDVGSASFSGILSASANKDIDCRVRHDSIGTESITLQYANFTIHYIGDGT